jgi:hypothetical protein
VLLRGTCEPHATNVRDYVGQAYSFHQPLPDGHRPWKLRPLQGGRSDVNLAPESVRPIFIRVLLDCLVPARSGPTGPSLREPSERKCSSI